MTSALSWHPSRLRTSIPFAIGDGPSEEGPRLGGRAPHGIEPRTPGLRYFVTVPFDPGTGRVCSVFVDPSSDFIFGGNASRSPTSRRRKASRFRVRSTSSEARPISRGGDLEEGVTTLLAAGYDQLLQIDFPGSDDGLVSGNWPLGTAMFHVLVRTTEHGHEWRYFWEP